MSWHWLENRYSFALGCRSFLELNAEVNELTVKLFMKSKITRSSM